MTERMVNLIPGKPAITMAEALKFWAHVDQTLIAQAAQIDQLSAENKALIEWGRLIYQYFEEHTQTYELALLLEQAPKTIKGGSA